MTGLDALLACPRCDKLHDVPAKPGAGLRCDRCGKRLIAPLRQSGLVNLGLALAGLSLAAGVLLTPFITVRSLGLSNATTFADFALSFSGWPIALGGLAIVLILVLPALRFALLAYALLPLVGGGRRLPSARRAFGLSEALRPWSMAEIFAIAAALALTKAADLVHVDIGTGFWLLLAMAAVGALQDGTVCRWSIWAALGRPRA